MTLKQNKLFSFNLDKILVKTFVLFINNGICNEKLDITFENCADYTDLAIIFEDYSVLKVVILN